MATQHSPLKTPSRRVLGDLTSRAINTPLVPSDLARVQSPLKQVTTHVPAASTNKENHATPNAYSKAKKRSIDEVESVETADNLKMLARARDDSLFSTDMRLTTDAMQRHTENNPIGLTDPGSPTERATPSPEPEPVQASQKSNQSFSDLLNYEMCASQKSEQAISLEPASVPAPAPVEEKKSRAEQLRTRLKFGLYKVKTNQVSKRDVDIIGTYEADASYSSDALHASKSTAMTSSGESLGSHQVPNITVSSPRREQGPIFVKANIDPYGPIKKLGPAPILAMPTGNEPVSTRMIHAYDFSSSPPDVELPKSVSPNQLMSPVRQRANYQIPPESRMRTGEHDAEHLDSREETRHERLQRLKQLHYEDGLASSCVKGNAAEGLLQLSMERGSNRSGL
ncbi:hypothetical protein BDW02DRAFT_538306 [Decorospora gaudefroyi]|uniref:Uncharacterized protein n=1 Tax=Decorospora gaudefroyi TaxID=184978 RepID=A0A6A5JXP6_9PLEO|nr:hypothetical protein BDW02DRAFT_538306 [Decorospora gaudefroyi]